jgi:hypothetical protein
MNLKGIILSFKKPIPRVTYCEILLYNILKMINARNGKQISRKERSG